MILKHCFGPGMETPEQFISLKERVTRMCYRRQCLFQQPVDRFAFKTRAVAIDASHFEINRKAGPSQLSFVARRSVFVPSAGIQTATMNGTKGSMIQLESTITVCCPVDPDLRKCR
jgi:hypothetical protein